MGAIVAVWMMWMVLAIGRDNVNAAYDIPVSNLPLYSDGIYFESLKPVKIQLSTWTLRADYDVRELVEEIAIANRTVAKLLQACAIMRTKVPDSCENIHNILELNTELNDFSDLLESFCETSAKSRSKRGLLRSWFGVMDDSDRTEILDNFSSVNDALGSQSSTMQLFFNTTNRALSAISGNLFQVDPKKPNTIDYSREGQLLLMDILLNKITQKKDLFMQLLQSSTTISLSDIIISPKRLLDEMTKLDKLLPPEFSFPVQLKLHEIIKMYSLSKVASYVDGCRLVVNILLPLCSRMEYQSLKGTSIPTVQNGVLKMFPLTNDVLVFNNTSHIGMVMTYEEYKQCIHLNDFALCNTHHLIKNLTMAEDCIVTTYFNRTHSDSDCRVSRMQMRHQIWIQLADVNSWIYVMPNVTDITINYGLTNAQTLTINGIGLLKLLRMCHVRSQDVLLQYIPQLGGRVSASQNANGFRLPVTVTRDQSLVIAATTKDNNRIIPIGTNAEAALQDPSHIAGLHYEPSHISPWAVMGIIFGVFIVLVIATKVYLKMVAEKRRRDAESEQQLQDNRDLNASFPSRNSIRAFFATVPTAPPGN